MGDILLESVNLLLDEPDLKNRVFLWMIITRGKKLNQSTLDKTCFELVLVLFSFC